MPPKSARAGAENWGKNWGKIPETRHKNGAANQQNCGKPVEKSAKLRFLIAASLSAPFGTKRSQVQILSPRPSPGSSKRRTGFSVIHNSSEICRFLWIFRCICKFCTVKYPELTNKKRAQNELHPLLHPFWFSFLGMLYIAFDSRPVFQPCEDFFGRPLLAGCTNPNCSAARAFAASVCRVSMWPRAILPTCGGNSAGVLSLCRTDRQYLPSGANLHFDHVRVHPDLP